MAQAVCLFFLPCRLRILYENGRRCREGPRARIPHRIAPPGEQQLPVLLACSSNRRRSLAEWQALPIFLTTGQLHPLNTLAAGLLVFGVLLLPFRRFQVAALLLVVVPASLWRLFNK